MNTIRKLFPEEIEALKPLLRTAYGAILEYQNWREAALELKMREAIGATLPILDKFKTFIPSYKRNYLDLLENPRLNRYDLIVCFDRAIYELHMRVESGHWAHLPWSQNLRGLLEERQQVEKIDRPDAEMFLVSGKGVSRGVAEGRARVLFEPSELGKVQPGEILVTPMTTPDFVLVAKRIAGLVTDQGGALCHAAILAREYRIPCIVGCQSATQTIRNGQRIRLDPAAGIVTGLEP